MAARLNMPVFLIGFMGAGKSTVASMLSGELGVPWVDVDELVETQAGRAVAQIFADEGEQGFRDRETQALRQLAAGPAQVVSCGGGAVERMENIEIMRDAGFVVCLDVSLEQAAARIPDASTRPLFQDEKAASDLLERRGPRYRWAAHELVPTNTRMPADVAADVQHVLREHGVLVNS